ncbi:MAG: hypothetical protein C5B49_08905 [Bdellovibrio sp.]|nr:MAG: hypothetical protein C5B49_08905 [Bdellovibrio sp.]
MESFTFRVLSEAETRGAYHWLAELASPQFNWSVGSLEELGRCSTAFAALQEGEAKAILFYRRAGDIFEIICLATQPVWRRRGLMKELIRRFMQTAHAEGTDSGGAARVWLDVHAENEAALGLYLSLGFEVVGRRRSYYMDGGDALLLKKVLPEPAN